ncbi:MAG: efflux RND transporter permease subunit, partial [Opitutales bacterium]|nr:efflux RND transporter permease subunit [Opitutales bacterium]
MEGMTVRAEDRDGGSAPAPRGLASTCIRRPVGTLAVASVVVVMGLFFIDRLPIDLLPEIERPQIRVTANYPGTAPEIMEEQVTRVLERNLAATENLIEIDSRASQGRTNVNLHFRHGTNIDLALQDAARHLELARTQLPPDIESLRLYKFDPAQDPVWQAGFRSSARSEVEVRDWVENRLAPQLVAIHGVSGVEAAGGLRREVEVIVDQERLRSYGLGMRHIIDTLAEENVDIAGGWVTSDTFDVMATTDGMFTSAEDIANVIIALPGGEGSRIRLSELAEVRDGYRDQRLYVRLDGAPASQVSVFKLPQANTVEVVDAIDATMERLRASGFIPEDIEYTAIGDPAFFIRGAIAGVGMAALLGGMLAMGVVFLFLGSFRRSFVIGLALPIAVMATFAMMGLGGLTLNIISLGGLALGVGLLLDNGIVMLENIFRHREKLGEAPEDAAHHGAREVGSAIVAGTLTNLAAVAPFLLVSGLAAQVFQELILTLSFAILATLAAALTLVPMLAVLLGRIRFESGLARSFFFRGFNNGLALLRRRYRRLLPRVLRWRAGVLAFAAGTLAAGLYLHGGLGQEFLPEVDDGSVHVRMVLPPGTPPDETYKAARGIESAVAEMGHVDSVFSFIGGHLGGGVVNERPGTANIRVQLVPAGERPEMPAGLWVAEAQEVLGALDLPGARISVRPPSIPGLHFGGDADLSISVVGEELERLHRLGAQVVSRLQGIEGLEGVEIGREDRSPILRVRVDRERAAAFGLRVSEVGGAIRDAVDGAVPTQFRSANQEYDVRVRLPREAASDAGTLGQMLVFRDDGEPIHLREVVSFELGEGPAHIVRENQNRAVRIVGDINTAVSDVGTVMGQVQERLAGLDLPEQYTLVCARHGRVVIGLKSRVS